MRSEHLAPETLATSELSLSELFSRYVRGQVSALEQGFTEPDVGVVPHDAGPVQPVDARLAWDEALFSLQLFGADRKQPRPPAEWKSLVAALEPALDLALCVGNFPQMVRNLQTLLQPTSFALAAETSPEPGLGLQMPSILEWSQQTAGKSSAHVLLAVGVLRLAREFDKARELLQMSTSADGAALNEEAALAWHAGQRQKALEMWQKQEATTAVLFNRGMAALFLNRPADARTALNQAISKLPESSSWHHLARLYLTLAEMRG